jgi:hypothetical protein
MKPAGNRASGQWAPPFGVLSWGGEHTKRNDGTRTTDDGISDDHYIIIFLPSHRSPLGVPHLYILTFCDLIESSNSAAMPLH